MRRFLLLFLSIILLWFLSPSSIKAAEDCETIFGGTCKVVCSQDERDLGTIYCRQPKESIRTCCLPKDEPVPKKSCGDPCMGAAECPSACTACQELIQGQGKVCRVPGGMTPAPPPGGGVQPTPCEVMDTTGIKTALGCIPTEDTSKFVAWLLGFAVGIGGGIAFLLMLFGAFQIMTSGGDPERLKAGKELIWSALAGLLVIIFSVFLLQLIGVQILQIPGFSK